MRFFLPALILGSSLHAAPAAFETFCFKCHDATQTEAELDLEGFVAETTNPTSVRTLDEIITRVREGDMPPKKSKKQPTDAERQAILAWAQSQIDAMAAATMDDPGVVVMPRLTRNEYRHVIRDLSGGIVTKAGEYLPNEGGAGEGFANVGEAQSMSTAQFEKYIEAAKGTLKHLRMSPHDGLVWSAVPRETVDEPKAAIKEATDDIIAWYVAQQQKWGALHRTALEERFGSAHALYLEAVWRAAHGRSAITQRLAPVALEKWTRILNDNETKSPYTDWAKAWRAIPANVNETKLRATCLAITTNKLGAALVENKGDFAPPYETSFREAKEEVLAAAKNEGRWPFRIDIGDAKELFLIMTDAGDGGGGEYGLWHKGRFIFKDGTAKPWQEVVKIVGGNSGRDFPWGLDGESQPNLEAGAVGQKPPGALKFAVPENAVVFEVDFALDKNRTKIASVQALVLKEKPPSQSFVPGRFVFGGREAKGSAKSDPNKERAQLLRKRNVSEANETKLGLNAESNLFADWTRTSIEAIGGPWPDQTPDRAEPNAPYYYTVAEVRRNATPEDHAQLRLLEERLVAIAQPAPKEVLESKAREWLSAFAAKAWRRPLQEADSAKLVQLYRDAAAQGVSFDSAMKVPLLTVLVSSDFIYKVASASAESDAPEVGLKPKPLFSHALASRLSFFLWASIPDDELLRLAAADKLRDPEVLIAQAKRMLKDPRAASLASDFAAQLWGFDDFETFTGPDEKRFPEFTAERRREMLDEVNAVLLRVFSNDEPLTRLLDEDCLATKPLFLTKTSLPLRTSPVQRGAWVVETLLGRRIPPPPPNVPQLSADEKSSEGLNIQQQLAKHRADANCATCHAKIDPPGIALENFDPIGRWRDAERDGTPIVNTETLQDGSTMNGVEGLKSWLNSREQEFRANFHRKLLGYALGRAVLPGDQALLERMNRQKTFSATVTEIVSSHQFTHRRSTP